MLPYLPHSEHTLDLPYSILLHQPGGGILSDLSKVAFDRVYFSQLGGANTFSFRIFEEIDGLKVPEYGRIRGKNLIRIFRAEEDLGFFEIQEVVESNDGISKSKVVNCMSSEVKLLRRKFYLTSGVFTLQQILNEVLLKIASWSIGHVDLSISNRSRYIDVVDENVYEFLLNTVQESYECVFDFDTVAREINVYSAVDYGNQTGMFFSLQNLIKALNLKDLTSEVCTRLYLYGDKEESIRDINFGQDYIENYSFFKSPEWMSTALISALDDYQALVELRRPIFTSYLTSKATMEGELITLQTALDEMEDQLTTLLSEEGLLIATNQSISAKRVEINAKESQISSQNNLINLKIGQITTKNNQMNAIADELSKSTNFSTEELGELDQFIFEELFQDSTYSVSERADYNERLSMQAELMETGQVMLAQLSQPRVSAEIDSANLFEIEEFAAWRSKLRVGDKIYAGLGDSPTIIRITGYTHSIDAKTLAVSIGDKNSIDESTFELLEVLKSAIKTGSTVSFERFQYKDYINNSKNEILDFLNNSFDITKKKIVSGTEQDKLWDESGLLFRMKVGTGFSPNQLKITNNAIALTDDGFNSVKVAIGPMPSGDYGVAAELLMGKLILGTKLEINTGNNLLTMDDTGFRVEDSTKKRQVIISPNEGIKIRTSATSGGAYSDKFSVDLSGNITYTGELRGTNDNPLTLTKGHITGSSININNKFLVNSVGQMQAIDGSFSGAITGGTMNIANKFLVSSAGILTATGANISGSITMGAGSSITWASVNSDPIATNAASTASSAASTASSAVALANAIGNGTYSGSFINGKEIFGPTVRANNFILQPETVGANTQKLTVKSWFNGGLLDVLEISSFAGPSPMATFKSPQGSDAWWQFSKTYFNGVLNFNGATLEQFPGVAAVFA